MKTKITKQKRIDGLDARIRTAKNLIEILSKDQAPEPEGVRASLTQEISECETLLVLARTN